MSSCTGKTQIVEKIDPKSKFSSAIGSLAMLNCGSGLSKMIEVGGMVQDAQSSTSNDDKDDAAGGTCSKFRLKQPPPVLDCLMLVSVLEDAKSEVVTTKHASHYRTKEKLLQANEMIQRMENEAVGLRAELSRLTKLNEDHNIIEEEEEAIITEINGVDKIGVEYVEREREGERGRNRGQCNKGDYIRGSSDGSIEVSKVRFYLIE